MPIVIAILTAVAGAIWWWVRSNPRDALDHASGAITTAINAPRRMAFKRQTNAHPVDSIDDPAIAVAVLGQAFVQLDAMPTQDTKNALTIGLRKTYGFSDDDISGVFAEGKWVLDYCGGPEPTIDRVGRRLWKIDQGQSWDDLQAVFMRSVQGDLSERQIDAVLGLKRALRVQTR